MPKVQNTLIFVNDLYKANFKSNANTFVPVSNPQADKYCSNPIYDNFCSKNEIEAVAKSNPRINEILKEYNLPLKVNIEELEALKKGHLTETRVIVSKIYSSLPKELKEEINIKSLQEAAMLHDYGKVLIPKSVLNKPDELNEYERKIMELHSELGYELLKNKNLSSETLNLIKIHHQSNKNNNYPKFQKDYDNTNLARQILMAADKYSALCEDRCYRNGLSKEEALKIIYQDVQDGNISEEVFNALKTCV